MKDCIAFVVHRYGLEINGGAEDECRSLAERLLGRYNVDVLTSCSMGSSPFDNCYPTGDSLLNGVTVRRFLVEFDKNVICRYEKKLHDIPYNEQQYIKDCGPYCPELINYLETNAHHYKAVIFFTSATYITTMGLLLGLDNSLLVPTMHEDSGVEKTIYHKAIKKAKGIIYNSIEERDYVVKHFDTGNIPGCLTCMGIDEHDGRTDETMREKYGRYILYAGRVSDGKNFAQLNDYFIEYKKAHNIPLKLLVIGRIDNYMRIIHHEDIQYLGFVNEDEKRALMHCADFLVLPSFMESLSIVILESMMESRPVLVNGNCAVLKGQCLRSNAGLWYTNYNEFSLCVTFLMNHKKICDEMGKSGKIFVKTNYSWSSVVARMSSFIDSVV